MAKGKKIKATTNVKMEKMNGGSKGIKMTLTQHEFGKLIPEMVEEQYVALRDDIEKQGLKDKIVLYGGSILEGWHRYKAMCELGRSINHKTQVEEYKGEDNEALAFVVSKNLKRRHLEPKQIGMILAQFEKHPAHRPLDQSDNSIGRSTLSAAELSKQHGIGEATLARARIIDAKGTEELKDAVVNGPISAEKGAEIAQLPAKQQKKAVKEALNPPKPPPKEENIKPMIRADIVYTGSYVPAMKNSDVPAKKDCVWFFRCKPDDIHQAFQVIDANGFEIVSFMTVAINSKQRYRDPFSDGDKDLVLIATKGDPGGVDGKSFKFGTVMPEQKFIEHFGKAYPDAKTMRATFYGTKPNANWQEWNKSK